MPDPHASNDYGSSAHFRLRLIRDRLAQHAVGAGGVGVIVAILLIFFYLLYVVMPLLEAPTMEAVASYEVAGGAPSLYLAMEEQAEVGVSFGADGRVRFFATGDGSEIRQLRLPLPRGTRVTTLAAARPASGVVALGLSNGQALVVRHRYRVSFPDDRRLITPELEYPLGDEPLTLDPYGHALQVLAIQSGEDGTTLAGWSGGTQLHLLQARPEESLLDDDGGFELFRRTTTNSVGPLQAMRMNPEQRALYLVGEDGRLAWLDISDVESPSLVEQIPVTAPGAGVRDVQLLAGGISLLIAGADGRVGQWFAVRDDAGERRMRLIRSFDVQAPLRTLAPEYARKGFATGEADGSVALYHATSHQRLLRQAVSTSPIRRLALAPRGDALLAQDADGRLHFWRVHNPHPEVSWSSLWGKVWYEGHDRPEYLWQSSAADNDFEPKLSLTPLTFGTFKAAFYAMLFAIPLSILGAIYAAYFMAPRMRRVVKPTIEIMEALPTVILGFLAGLWLAPLVENHLPGVFALLIVLPFGILLAAWLWHHAPQRWKSVVPEGWEAALLVPVLIGLGVLALQLSPWLERALFGGDMPHWLNTELGIGFDQRNSLVVGMAMGFAIIPTIFSIAEDAIFSVPRHLTNGSLALGATPWQTLVRVVLLTASPGIFSGIMMGVGRAVGETMIVLMATGNTPVMDMSIFQGMRTLSANIAVEVPEAEVASTHYRVLFLAALVLFLFTFAFNTGAELVRQRLRRKYSSL